jgi:hypothetical protein
MRWGREAAEAGGGDITRGWEKEGWQEGHNLPW